MSLQYSKAEWAKIEAILDEVLDLPEHECAARIEVLCGENSALCADIIDLIQQDRLGEDIVSRPAMDLVPSLINSGAEADVAMPFGHNTQIGPYRLCDELGRGGMGVVYRAERNDGEFAQEVAIKLLPQQRHDSLAVERFRREQQLLASLDHPNIARLYDGGFTDNGYAYIVMEHVAGQAIDRYCREHRLSVKARLHLLIKVIDSLAYAHNQLVVHRDIKPSNILVTADGSVKLLDFGIAKLLDGHELEGLTQTGEHIMTPGFAAPEQFNNTNVTAATDVYQLGVLIYHLLTGKHVYRDRARSMTELIHLISNEEPSAPSKVLSLATKLNLGDRDRSSTSVDPLHAPSERARLQKILRGDLDAIVLKMLQNRPQDRYASMRAVELDLRAYFDSRPVSARAQSVRYQVQKFVRRHWRLVSIVAVFVGTLVGYTATVSYQAKQISKALVRTQIAQAKAESVSEFLTSVFKAADPNVASLEKLSAQNILARGEARILTELKNVPEIQSHMLNLIGEIYFSQGAYERSIGLLRSSLANHRQEGVNNVSLARALTSLAIAYLYSGDYAAAIALFEESLDIHETLRSLDATQTRIDYAETLAAYGELKFWQGATDEAMSMLKTAVDILLPLDDGRHEELATALNNLAQIQHARGEFSQARTNMRQAITIQKRVLGENHSYYTVHLKNFAIMLVDMEEFDEAESLALQALNIQQQLLDAKHPYIVETLKALGVLYYRKGHLEQAQTYLQDAVDMYRADKDTISKAAAFMWLGSVLRDQGHVQDAADLYTRMNNIFASKTKNGGIIGRGLGQMASLKFIQGHFADAEKIYQQALELMPADNMRITFVQVGYAQLLIALEQYTVAEKLLDQALVTRRQKFPPGHSFIAEAEVLLGTTLYHQGRNLEAEALLRSGITSLTSRPLYQYGHRRELLSNGQKALAWLTPSKLQ